MTGSFTRGVLFVHSIPPALCPHVQWAAGNALGHEVRLEWIEQPAAPGMLRGELSWTGTVGTGARLASALRGWEHLRYEVTEEPALGSDGARWAHTPELGVFHSQVDSVGNVVVGEDRIRSAMQAAESHGELVSALDMVLGKPWDDELEPFRHAGVGAPVRWLHRVG